MCPGGPSIDPLMWRSEASTTTSRWIRSLSRATVPSSDRAVPPATDPPSSLSGGGE